ncbi:MAG: TauD/TfdA family dioxygenase, partial [Lautropia sp.]
MKQATKRLPAERVIAPYAEMIDKQGHPEFAAVIYGIDLTRPLTDDEMGAIHAAIDRYGVLVFRDQHLDDAQQVAFSRQLGPLELATGDIGEVK